MYMSSAVLWTVVFVSCSRWGGSVELVSRRVVSSGSRRGRGGTPYLGCCCRDTGRAVIVQQPKSANTAEQTDCTRTHISAPRCASVYPHHHYAACIDLYRRHLAHDCASVIRPSPTMPSPTMPAPYIWKEFDRLHCSVTLDHFVKR
jgi:hypothetical protein